MSRQIDNACASAVLMPAVARVKAAFTATAIAESFRDEGKDVPAYVGTINRGWDVAKYLLGHERMGSGNVGGSKRELAALRTLAIDELTEMTGIDAERAKQLITTARAHWFE